MTNRRMFERLRANHLRAEIVLIALAASTAFAVQVRATLLVYEPFDYPTGSLNGANGGIGFSGPWTADAAYSVTSDSLGIPGNQGNDAQFSSFVLNPLLATVFSSIGIPVPPPPRNDLLLLVQYEAPICPGCGPNDVGPIADLLRLNTGIPPTAVGQQNEAGRMGRGRLDGFPHVRQRGLRRFHSVLCREGDQNSLGRVQLFLQQPQLPGIEHVGGDKELARSHGSRRF